MKDVRGNEAITTQGRRPRTPWRGVRSSWEMLCSIFVNVTTPREHTNDYVSLRDKQAFSLVRKNHTPFEYGRQDDYP